MTETLLDSLVVRIRADTRDLEHGLTATRTGLQRLGEVAGAAGGATSGLARLGAGVTRDLERATDTAARRMAGSFEAMARSGQLSFSSLRSTALGALAEIASGFLQTGLGALVGSGAGFLNPLLPGRAAGGPVSARQSYLVGERGPEVFVPAATGRIVPYVAATHGHGQPERRAPSISITVNTTGGERAARQSAAQVALAVRRALGRSERTL